MNVHSPQALHPEKTLEPEAQEEVREGREHLRCAVCKVGVRKAMARLDETRKLPEFKDRWQRHPLVTDIVQRVCHGADFDAVQEGFLPSVPGNPPLWADDYDVGKGAAGEWQMKRRVPPVPAPARTRRLRARARRGVTRGRAARRARARRRRKAGRRTRRWSWRAPSSRRRAAPPSTTGAPHPGRASPGAGRARRRPARG